MASPASDARAAAPLSISVQGNHLVNQDGSVVRLLGANETSSEYACYFGYAYMQYDPATLAAAMATWHVTAARIPLNEDCWLGINGYPHTATNQPTLTQAGYQQKIIDFVNDLNAQGIYAVLDLHWAAPGTNPASGQEQMPDDHSAAFWTSVASTFKTNPAVMFDTFNEPNTGYGGPNDPPTVSWDCWKSGGCPVIDAAGHSYTAVGQQTLVSAIRATGATQPILLEGLGEYGNDLSQWLTHEPSDTLAPPQLAASLHAYGNTEVANTDPNYCNTTACFDTNVAPVAAQVPVYFGEFGDFGCSNVNGQPNGDLSTNYDNTLMSWADAHGASYTAWAWLVPDGGNNCGSTTAVASLVNDPSGVPAQPNGVALKDHLAVLAGGGPAPPTAPPPTSSPPPPPVPMPPPPVPAPPAIIRATQSHALWREGDRLATLAKKKHNQAKHPLGTTFSVTLNEQATISLAFSDQIAGRKVKGRCVSKTKSNGRDHVCNHPMTVATLVLTGHAGLNQISFQGRISNSQKLRPGYYTLVILATTAGKTSTPVKLSFTIVKR